MTRLAIPKRPARYAHRVALVLQGGGALGSYQAGVYAALAGSQYEPDWVAGISIGAINAALIAGNAPRHRVERLRAFWDQVTEAPSPWHALLSTAARNPFIDHAQLGATSALLFGQAGFFAPRPPGAWIGQPAPVSYYDTAELKATLERLVDFDRINAGETRFSVAAVNVRTGNFAYFDNAEMPIRAEHIMASGALPPGFPAIEIDGEAWWDGGLVSNTPLQRILAEYPRDDRLTFQVDVFPARGPLPTNLDEVGEREKDIRYSSRTRAVTDTARQTHDLRFLFNRLWEKLPEDLRATPEARRLHEFSCITHQDIAQLIYRPARPEGQTKDFEFSRATMQQRWAAGEKDAMATLLASPWLAPMPHGQATRTFDVNRPAET